MRIVLVEWWDIHQTADWIGDIEGFAPAPITTVGQLVKKEEHCVWIAPTWAEEPSATERYCTLWAIPTGVIRSIKDLKL